MLVRCFVLDVYENPGQVPAYKEAAAKTARIAMRDRWMQRRRPPTDIRILQDPGFSRANMGKYMRAIN